MSPIFEAKGISMRLDGGRWLFKDIDIKLDKGDVLVLQGPSGSGKTTLLKCLAELIPYTDGYCTLYGKKPSDYGVPVWRSKVMYVPQRPSAHPGCPLDLFRMIKRFSSQKHKKTHSPIEIGLNWNLSESHFHESWSNLSGGEMQRCALAIALAFNPDVILLDEPTSALDPESAEKVETDLKKYACIWITHDPQQAERVSTGGLALSSPNSHQSSSESSSTSSNKKHNDNRTVVDMS